MRKRKKLEPGEIVVLVYRNRYWDSVDITAKCEVVRANGTSAYLVRCDGKGREYKISQKDFRGSDTVYSYKVYRSMEDYEKSVADANELSDLQSWARGQLKNMSLNQMRALVTAMKRGEFDG